MDFEDLSWEEGCSGFGYGDGDDATLVPMRGISTSLFLRKKFKLDKSRGYTGFRLKVCADDGFVAYLNGKEVRRVRVNRRFPTIPVHTVPRWNPPRPPVVSEIPLDPELFRDGPNVLAIQGLNLRRDDRSFTLIPILEAELPADLEKENALLEERRSAMQGDRADALLAYLEGRILQRAGRSEEAEARFREAVRIAPTAPEPTLQLAEVLVSLGKPESAEEGLRSALRGDLRQNRWIWKRWAVISFKDLRRDPADVLKNFPVKSRGASRYGENLRWLLGQLESGRSLRINCGSAGSAGDYSSRDGKVWRRDGFSLGGLWMRQTGLRVDPASVDVEDTEDDELYKKACIFGRWSRGKVYSIPLPPGRYRVILYFAEMWFGVQRKEGQRRFEVSVEGKLELEEFEPTVKKVTVHDVLTRVDDGKLDIEFRHGSMADPMISAIEIQRLN